MLNSALDMMAADLCRQGEPISGNIEIPVRLPRAAYRFFGNLSWVQAAKKHGLKKKDLRRKPYRI